MKINYVLESIFILQQKIEDYMVCEKIWDKFKMKNMGDYHDHYLKKDVLLLADIFEKFIDTCLKYLEKYLTLTNIYLMKKDQGEEYLMLLKDMLRQIINT